MILYHGTLAALRPGDLIVPGGGGQVFVQSRPGRVYATTDPAWACFHAFCALRAQAGLLPAWARRPGRGARPRVYAVRAEGRTYAYTSTLGGVPAPAPARWSRQPLTVRYEVPLSDKLLAEAADLIADVSRQMGAR